MGLFDWDWSAFGEANIIGEICDLPDWQKAMIYDELRKRNKAEKKREKASVAGWLDDFAFDLEEDEI